MLHLDDSLERLLQAHDLGLAIVDRELRVAACSELFRRLVWPGESASAGRPLAELYPEMAGLQEEAERVLAEPGAVFSLVCVNRDLADGETRLLDIHLTHLAALPGKLLMTVQDRTVQRRLEQEVRQQRNELLLLQSALGAQQQALTKTLLGRSPAIQQLQSRLQKVAQSPAATILLHGESGTGKSHVARLIHQLTHQTEAPFVEVNCAALPESLLEAELFGFEKGAFTHAVKAKPGLIEAAAGGTLFLDEIAELPLNLQAKLLLVIENRTFRRLGSTQERRVQLRYIAATSRDLAAAVAEKKFRDDLFYRLNVVSLSLPPLRELGDDILLLAEHFLKIYNLDFKRNVRGFSPAARQALLAHSWPGNVRELRNLIERAMIFCEGSILEATDLALPPPADKPAPPAFVLPAEGVQLEDLEKSLLQQALQRTGGNKTRAAALLGLSRDTLRYRLEKFGIE
ncbi:MAG: sigma 54-interacting transcriptional regulator [candidate division KSB1 bacterium]|nr:sigma 54-interacting transcriptional regulator [candidate division KSB1 bacterium]MDZ7273080.1 sigma 54-interacting transcriptional regulator [candidate division KSB1 bacterium]MDZ7285183.1 sigma 54-interacting transcriptional regulator [candidate division KSB1 bacterium]MDZ7298215.1 sigma 54-interacting transcriptional regulator [candidate division KSB1 bacterium]MDZ7306889.1 sigma 54-interacting transcriptional regulator [candidate division KSB1 bacterium]